MEVVGTPTPELLQKICSEHVRQTRRTRPSSPRDNVFDAGVCSQAQKYIQSLPFMPQQDLEKIFRGANPLGGCSRRRRDSAASPTSSSSLSLSLL